MSEQTPAPAQVSAPPALTVVTVVLNDAQGIRATIESVLGQRGPSLEYIIVDGGSTDGTLDIVRSYADRITHLISEPDRGIYDAMNKGIRLARGRCIGLLNSGDWYEPGCLAYVEARLAGIHEQRFVLAGGINRVDHADQTVETILVSREREAGRFCTMPLNHPAMFVARAVYEALGEYNIARRIASDYEFVLAALEQGVRVHYAPYIFVNMRTGGLSEQPRMFPVRLRESFAIRSKYLKPLRCAGISILDVAAALWVYSGLKNQALNLSRLQDLLGAYLSYFYLHLRTGRLPRWVSVRAPRTFSEKILHLKLYHRPPLGSIYADKVRVRELVADEVGPHLLVPCLGVFRRPEDIDLEALPAQFVVKPNHLSGKILICHDKSQIDWPAACVEMSKWLKTNYFTLGREHQYREIPRRLIVEKLLLGPGYRDLRDYKFFCFNGEPRLIQVDIDRYGTHRRNFFDADWRRLDLRVLFSGYDGEVPRPSALPEMLAVARRLSRNLCFARVDLYHAENRVLFGEITLHPGGGVEPVTPANMESVLGDYLRVTAPRSSLPAPAMVTCSRPARAPTAPAVGCLPLAVQAGSETSYPGPEDHFSPSTPYPWYRHGSLAVRRNGVYDAVTKLFEDSGLDSEHLGTAQWNPLGRAIASGSRVFVLCNFVYHRRPGETIEEFQSKCTHASVLRALIDYILLAVGPSGSVAFGNAPLQSCDWEAVLADTGADRMLDFYRGKGLPVTAQDLRAVVSRRSRIGAETHRVEMGAAESLSVDLRRDSLLQARRTGGAFRVSDYDPRETEACHAGDSHVYHVNRAIIDADVVFNVPKLKTHEKVGITCCLKALVGTVSSKSCLAHHRFGSPAVGGDEYPGQNPLRLLESRYHDWVNRLPANSMAKAMHTGLNVLLRAGFRKMGLIQGGAWYGNDTCWRMAHDLAKIVTFADRHGVLQTSPQRTTLSLIDGIIGGEGNGPLDPKPIRSGVLILGDNFFLCDVAAAKCMGYDWSKVPLIRASRDLLTEYRSDAAVGRAPLYLNGQVAELGSLRVPTELAFRPPDGWRAKIEARGE
jgi:uncharacterized protein (DUF362 family)/glycosyltransferase involved in cell wall biosynthesis